MATRKISSKSKDAYIMETIGGLKSDVSSIRSDLSQFRGFAEEQFKEVKASIVPLRKRVYVGTGILIAIAAILQYFIAPAAVRHFFPAKVPAEIIQTIDSTVMVKKI